MPRDKQLPLVFTITPVQYLQRLSSKNSRGQTVERSHHNREKSKKRSSATQPEAESRYDVSVVATVTAVPGVRLLVTSFTLFRLLVFSGLYSGRIAVVSFSFAFTAPC